MSKGKITVLVMCIFVLLTSFAIFAGVGTLLWAENTIKDNDGFYNAETIQVEKNSYAIVARLTNIVIHSGSDWPWGWDVDDFTTLKVEGSNNSLLNHIFIGVASVSDVDDYLSGVEFDEIARLHIYPYNVDYQNHPGSIVPGDPTLQTFWAESTCGTGTQILEWELEPDSYSLVLMNGDASAGIDMNIVVGAKTHLLIEEIVEGFIFGGMFLFMSILAIYFLLRRPSTVPSKSTEVPPSTEDEGEKPYE